MFSKLSHPVTRSQAGALPRDQCRVQPEGIKPVPFLRRVTRSGSYNLFISWQFSSILLDVSPVSTGGLE